MGHLNSNHQWDMHIHNLSLLTPARARGTNISPKVRHRHRLFRIEAREARPWIEVEYRAYRPGLEVEKLARPGGLARSTRN